MHHDDDLYLFGFHRFYLDKGDTKLMKEFEIELKFSVIPMPKFNPFTPHSILRDLIHNIQPIVFHNCTLAHQLLRSIAVSERFRYDAFTNGWCCCHRSSPSIYLRRFQNFVVMIWKRLDHTLFCYQFFQNLRYALCKISQSVLVCCSSR